MSVFNKSNDAWKTGVYPLFLGQEMGLLDTVNTPYPKLFELYKLQKSLDWDEEEVNLEQSRQDMMTCQRSTYDIMIKNLAFQSELDSVASRAIAPLLAPFITNTELWLGVTKISEIENLHAICYTTIIRNCVKDTDEFFLEVVKNEQITNRSTKVVEVFNELQRIGALYTLDRDSIPRNDIIKVLIKAYVALYCLERLQFMSSFAATFAVAEQGIMVGIAKLVQKISQDEQVHAAFDEEVIRILQKDKEFSEQMKLIKPEIQGIVDEVVQQELAWNDYLFSEGRSIVGLNSTLLSEWVFYNAQVVYSFLGLKNPHPKIKDIPLTWMNDWLDVNKFQNANQEADNNNYSLNVVISDLDENEELEF